ncbi:AcrR family transcriptional regulator [Bacillus mesophilus]|uniref:TetR/AcrR family transcriptional regulator n=2 Tax=Bacillus mesophilus TaxID=1808955 RepID=A0A6M0QBC6_9BACI|nr:AcrR family transcriptional regulator [Bacillus mesophilus]NEY73557.1 TetR/AcrR family transcriptional regulator [Bacillus mesophilus]
MKQFVLSGYDKASTNEIVKDAQISKGSLFNYFTNKKELYMYLVENAIKIMDVIYDGIDMNERDLFNRITQIGLIKLEIQKKHPLVFDFLKSTHEEQATEVKADIEKVMGNVLNEGLNRIYENLDYSRFRDDVNPEKAFQILNWTMAGFSELQLKQLTSYKNVGVELINEWNSYSDILRRCFYKD